MKKADYIPLVIVAGLFGFIAALRLRAPSSSTTTAETVADSSPGVAPSRTTSTAASVAAAGRPPDDVDATVRITSDPAPVRDLDDLRRQLRMGESGTYLTAMLKQLDSALYRWNDRLVDPLRVWIAAAPGPEPDVQVREVRSAFNEWASLGIPVRFTFVVQRGDADIVVNWIDRFTSDNRVGNTRWVHDQHLWMQPGTEITIATHYMQGQLIPTTLIRGVALHEIGHLLGMPHSPDTTDIMFPKMHSPQLSQADRATVRLLYSVPAGSVK